MANEPTAGQSSAIYTLTSPRGNSAVFNDEASPDFVGSLAGDDAVSGLDSPEVRQTLHDLVEADGSISSQVFHGPRPFTLQGFIKAPSISVRNDRETKLRQVVNECMRADGTLTWTPDGGLSQRLNVRKNQPIRVRGGFVKEFLIAMVAADPRIYGSTLNTLTDTGTPLTLAVVNDGNGDSPPVLIRVTGPVTNPLVRRVQGSNDDALKFAGLVIAGGAFIDINMLNKTAVDNLGASVYSFVDFPANADWWELLPGSNTVTVEGTGQTAASALRVDWRSVWL